MIFLVCGLLLWSFAHLFKRLAPTRRAALGGAGRGLVTLGIAAGLALMIYGYSSADFITVWTPPSWLVHVNNLLMLVAVVLFGMSATTGRLRGRMRHPMLAAVKVWALAHLLVNGDLASVLLFGGMLSWAVVQMIVINRSEAWDRPEPGAARKDILLAVISVVMFALITGLHSWLGVWPFPG